MMHISRKYPYIGKNAPENQFKGENITINAQNIKNMKSFVSQSHTSQDKHKISYYHYQQNPSNIKISHVPNCE